jgi:hypothetical protein
MQIGAGFVVLALAAALLAPSVASAADARVGGKGPRVMRPDGRFVSPSGRRVFIVDDNFADFGDLQTTTAPPLRIEVKGDVEIVPLANGGVRIVFIDE